MSELAPMNQDASRTADHELGHLLVAYSLPDATIGPLYIAESESHPGLYHGGAYVAGSSVRSKAIICAAGFVGEAMFNRHPHPFFEECSDHQRMCEFAQQAGMAPEDIQEQARKILETDQNWRRWNALKGYLEVQGQQSRYDLSECQIQVLINEADSGNGDVVMAQASESDLPWMAIVPWAIIGLLILGGLVVNGIPR